MTAVWDEAKRQANLLKHGLDSAEFETAFDGEDAVYLPAQPSRTGRIRYKIIGRWRDRLVVVVIVSPLGAEAIALVSLRYANPKERAVHDRLRSQDRRAGIFPSGLG